MLEIVNNRFLRSKGTTDQKVNFTNQFKKNIYDLSILPQDSFLFGSNNHFYRTFVFCIEYKYNGQHLCWSTFFFGLPPPDLTKNDSQINGWLNLFNVKTIIPATAWAAITPTAPRTIQWLSWEFLWNNHVGSTLFTVYFRVSYSF